MAIKSISKKIKISRISKNRSFKIIWMMMLIRVVSARSQWCAPRLKSARFLFVNSVKFVLSRRYALSQKCAQIQLSALSLKCAQNHALRNTFL